MSRSSAMRFSGASSRVNSSVLTSRAAAAPTVPLGGFYGGIRDPSRKITEYMDVNDKCPVCHTERYDNKKMRLLVSSCYHKMCESCIERKFGQGPAPCPICGAQIRKNTFITQTFEDLTVERETAIRRRMNKEFNKRPENFPDLKSYNDYLEEVEEITSNLINGIDVERMEARIAAYRAENAALIELNIQREERDLMNAQEEEERQRIERLERAKEIRREEELERAERAKEGQKILEGLARGTNDPKALVAQSRAAIAKRVEKRIASRNASIMATMSSAKRKGEVTIPDPPHQPFADNWYAYEDKYVLRRDYDDGVSELVRSEMALLMQAGGYRVEEAWDRAIRCAVAGLETMPLVD
ncbi:TFIIH/NER complex subunit [Serendipita sp. 401]|nr:TFIIH/NER complex subunit [Serendipita sp. 397]KAG8814645.1 TFIIH/NER complex subunit [Serendipita sp. 401]KAG9045882.1 TFIIH/NER complex subunit [Serendipita sp. 407]